MDERLRVELAAIEAIDGGLREGSFIEFKSTLPSEERKVARQIAGACNAARGAEVLWLVGVEDSGEVGGTSLSDLQDWWPKILRCFDGPAPSLIDVAVNHPQGRVMVLAFRTDQAPYVVRTTGENPSREIPWREATSTRSATRHEILSILLPRKDVPDAEIVSIGGVIEDRSFFAESYNAGPPEEFRYNAMIMADVFIEAFEPVSFPAHRQFAFVDIPDLAVHGRQIGVVLGFVGESSPTPKAHEPGTLKIRAGFDFWLSKEKRAEFHAPRKITTRLELSISGGRRPIIFERSLSYSSSSGKPSQSGRSQGAYHYKLSK